MERAHFAARVRSCGTINRPSTRNTTPDWLRAYRESGQSGTLGTGRSCPTFARIPHRLRHVPIALREVAVGSLRHPRTPGHRTCVEGVECSHRSTSGDSRSRITEGRSAVSVMETPAITHSVRSRISPSASAGLPDDPRPHTPEPAHQVEPVGEWEDHPSFARDAPLNDPLTRADSGIAMRRRHHITCSACQVTYLGLSAPQESAQTAAWVCARCTDGPDGTDVGPAAPSATRDAAP